MVKYVTQIILQCWILNECKLNEKVTDKNFSEFLSELNDLVHSAHRYHLKIQYKPI